MRRHVLETVSARRCLNLRSTLRERLFNEEGVQSGWGSTFRCEARLTGREDHPILLAGRTGDDTTTDC